MKADYKCITSKEEIIHYLDGAREVAFDYEVAPDEKYRNEDKAALDPAKSHIVGCSFSVKEGTGIYVPVHHKTGPNIEEPIFIGILKMLLENTDVIKIAHNLAYESMMSCKYGIIIKDLIKDALQR